MFDIGWSELVVIGVVALIAIGPKELPGALRTLGQWAGKVRRMASEFQDQFREAMREAEMADVKKDVDDAMRAFDTNLNPLADVEKQIDSALDTTPTPAEAESVTAATSDTATASIDPAAAEQPAAETSSAPDTASAEGPRA